MKNFLENFFERVWVRKKTPLMEIGEFFWKILDGEPWAFSNTPFYGGG